MSLYSQCMSDSAMGPCVKLMSTTVMMKEYSEDLNTVVIFVSILFLSTLVMLLTWVLWGTGWSVLCGHTCLYFQHIEQGQTEFARDKLLSPQDCTWFILQRTSCCHSKCRFWRMFHELQVGEGWLQYCYFPPDRRSMATTPIIPSIFGMPLTT